MVGEAAGDHSHELDRVEFRVRTADATRERAAGRSGEHELVLTGPAGGTFRRGVGGARTELDAIEFVRVISGRLPDHDLVQTNSLPL